MSFMMKKKRFKFQVTFEVEELASVPFVSGVLFAKIRLLDGGSFTEHSSREEVSNHRVRWRAKFPFACKMVANASTGVLEPCICRVSVRKELKGGRSYQKLGFADVNLAEFAGAGKMCRRYLLEGYDSKRRQDNSTLKVNIDTTLLSGDPCFKAPQSLRPILPGEPIEDLQPENKGPDDYSGDSVASGSSGFGSLPRKNRTSLVSTDSGPSDDEAKKQEKAAAGGGGGGEDFELGHSRNSSHTSEQSKGSGYSSQHTHSRQSSYGTDPATQQLHTHTRPGPARYSLTKIIDLNDLSIKTPSTGSADPSKIGSLRQRTLEKASSKERRVDQTRIDAEELVDEIFKVTDLKIDESAETSGLQLFVGKDGSTALGSHQIRNKMTGTFEQVIIDKS